MKPRLVFRLKTLPTKGNRPNGDDSRRALGLDK
jgi:hypothetical protein